jgi:TonB family protein
MMVLLPALMALTLGNDPSAAPGQITTTITNAQGQRVTLPAGSTPVVTFPSPPPPGPPPRDVITRPDWVHTPDAADLARYYPPAAFERGTEGHSTMRCTVTAQGTLTSCVVISETPAGVGFGAALLRLTRFFAMRTTTAEGRSVAGAQVDIPVRWTPGPDRPPPIVSAPH